MLIGTVYQQPLPQCAPGIFYNLSLQTVAQLELYGPRPHLLVIQVDSVARGPKLLSIKNYIIEIMT